MAVNAGRVEIPADEITVRFSRSGGPGGQNVNKRATRVELTWEPGASRALTPAQRARAVERLGHRLDARGRVHVVASAARTQEANRRAALGRLEDLLGEALRPPPPPRRKTAPTRGATERRLQEKKARSRVKRLRGRPEED